MTATNATTTITSQELLDELVGQDYPADDVTETVERMVARGCIEHKPTDDEPELILTEDEAQVARRHVANGTSPTAPLPSL